ncbi:MAG: threonine--tRNA ligase [Candidatus Saccharimonadales bacterium]
MVNNKDQTHAMRHSLAHIMAAAIKELWSEVRFGVGPVIDNGFYYDVDLGGKVITEDDLPKIESKMKDLIKADLAFEQFDLPIDEAIKKETDNNQLYKAELLDDLKKKGTTSVSDIDPNTLDASKVDNVSYYRCGNFEDLCRGPHLASTGKVGVFKLHKLAGAYWRGDESKPMLQRIYGIAFKTQKELDEHFELMFEAEKRDHRKLGQELDLFTFSDLVGSGLPLFKPKGATLRSLLSRYSQQLRQERGFEEVWIPHITKTDLYKQSGHWDKFGDELFMVQSQETSDDLALKPMNCPHHAQIYTSQMHSYRDLPVKYMESTTVYRDEKSGELHGLSRVRSITMDDSHVFATPNQVESVVTELVEAAQELYKVLGMDLSLRLSFRDDTNNYLGEESLWNKAQLSLESIAKKQKLEYIVEAGEAAFYGPKLDFMATDAIGREWQLATVQLDFVQPQRFGLEYVSEDGSRQTPVMVHAALLGSIERFLSVYIEHTNGRFPFWVAPEQVRILTVNEDVLNYVREVTEILSGTVLVKPLNHNQLRFSVDSSNQSLGKKIRQAETEKVPVILIVGPKDEKAHEVSVRKDGKEQKIKLDNIKEFLLGI